MFSIKKLQNKFTPKKRYLQPSTKLKKYIFSTPHSQKLQSKNKETKNLCQAIHTNPSAMAIASHRHQTPMAPPLDTAHRRPNNPKALPLPMAPHPKNPTPTPLTLFSPPSTAQLHYPFLPPNLTSHQRKISHLKTTPPTLATLLLLRVITAHLRL